MSSVLTVREWLLLNEVNSTKALIRSQIDEQLDKAISVERVQHLTTSSVVFERYLAPVFEVANRLLWPPVRQKSMSDWKRTVHTKVEDLVVSRKKSIESEMGYEVAAIRQSQEPNFKRLVKIIDETRDISTKEALIATIKEEIKLIAKHNRGQDKKMVLALKGKGIERIRMLRSRLFELDEVALSEFLTSKKYIKDIQSEVIDYILSIQNEKLRRRTWGQFEKKLLNILHRKQLLLARGREEAEMAATPARDESLAEAFIEESQRLFPEIKRLDPKVIYSDKVADADLQEDEYLLPEN